MYHNLITTVESPASPDLMGGNPAAGDDESALEGLPGESV